MIALTEEFKVQRGLKLVALIERDVQDMWPRYEKVREHRSLYDGTATAMMPLPWEDASNIHLPVLQDKVEVLSPMLMTAFWGVEPVVNVQRSPEEYDQDSTDDVEQFMNFVVEKDVPNLHETTECWFRAMVLDGMSTIKPHWSYKMRRVSEIQNLKIMLDVGDSDAFGEEIQQGRPKSAMELLVEIFGMPNAERGLIDAVPMNEVNPDDPDHAFGSVWQVQFMENRQEYFGEVSFTNNRFVDEVKAHIRRMVVDEEVTRIDVIEYEDIIVPFRTTDLQTADRVTQRYWVTVDDLQEKYDTGEWEMEEGDLERLLNSGRRKEDTSTIIPQLQEQKDGVTGENRGQTSEDRIDMPKEFAPYNRNKIMVFAVHLRDSVDTSGIREEVIYHIPYGIRKIVRAEYLDEEFPHGRRPFITAKYIPISNRWFGIGMGDQLAAVNLEINTIINYVNNNQELINNPFFFYEPTSFNVDSQSTLNLAPGQGIPVISTQGILFPTFSQQPLANMEILTSLLMFADRITITPLNAGSTQMKNAPRTARGTFALLGEGHVKTDMLITRLQRGPWMEMMEQIFGLHQAFCPDEKWYWIVRNGQRQPVRMSREILRGRYEFTFKGNTTNTNREMLRQIAQVRYNTVMTHPDYAVDPQVRRNALADMLKYWGDGTDVDLLMPAMPGEGAYNHPPMRQQDENKVLQLETPHIALPSDDHATHLQVMEQFENTKAFEMMSEAAVGLWAMHRQQHMDMLRQQQQQSQQPVSPGQGNNVPSGSMLDSSGASNVMEGGNAR